METDSLKYPHLSAVLEEYAVFVRNTYQDNLIRKGKIAGGDLLNSVEYKVTIGDKSAIVSLVLEDYWRYVEYGRKPLSKFPPPSVIQRWIQVKPILPRPDKNGRLPSLKSLSFLIGRKIAREGIPPTSALGTATATGNAAYLERIKEALQADTLDWVIQAIKYHAV